MLPSVGLVVGLLWFLLALISYKLGLPYLLSGFLMTAYIYGITGFFPLDGFMDVRDAVMSRRDLEERQRILKDSHVGAFSVISVVILILGMFAGISGYMYLIEKIALTATSEISASLFFFPFIIIPIASRDIAGRAVLKYKPMKSSQYADMESLNKKSEKEILPTRILGIQSGLYILILLMILLISGRYVSWLQEGRGLSTLLEAGLLVVLLATIIGTRVAIKRSKKELGGMNGDIAGYGICMGELIGVIAMPILTCIWMAIFL